MERKIDDKDYIECLKTSVYRTHYRLWRERMLTKIEDIVAALETASPEEVMYSYSLSPRDMALLVRLGYFTKDEVERFDLRRIECTVPE